MPDYRYMNMRSIGPIVNSTQAPKKPKTNNQSGFIKMLVILVVCVCLVWAYLSVFKTSNVSAIAIIPNIRSDVAGYCLNDYLNQINPGSPVYASLCNGNTAQSWVFIRSHIIHSVKYCLGEINKSAVIESCQAKQHITWVKDGVGYKNTSNNLCLSIPGGKTNVQLVTTSCNDLTSVNEAWTQTHWSGTPLTALSSPNCTMHNLGARVACIAQRQWLAWQTEPQLHNALLNDYTDGNPYEEWCADFVSYVYKQAGAPFTGGERGGGWDEYNANNIINMGFSYHAANSGYIPQPGDVAFFNYAGGHVEIVVKGGKHPLFIYGDSGTIDPITKNGDMAENHITQDGQAGHIVYYLSPN